VGDSGEKASTPPSKKRAFTEMSGYEENIALSNSVSPPSKRKKFNSVGLEKEAEHLELQSLSAHTPKFASPAYTQECGEKVSKVTKKSGESKEGEEAKSLTQSKLILCFQRDLTFVDAELISCPSKESRATFLSLKPSQDHEDSAEAALIESEKEQVHSQVEV
jgi:hypothetical protein